MKTKPGFATKIFDRLEAQHPNAWTELHFSNPYELLVATILSAQCTDARVNQVTPTLFARYPDAAALSRATTDQLEPLLQPTGFFRAKSRSLLGMAQAVVERHGGAIPSDMEELTELKGVGRKTANVVRGHAVRHSRASGGSPRAARGESHRPGPLERRRKSRSGVVRPPAAGAMDARIGHADSARTPHLQAEAALRSL
jgi:hypothetical protein